MMLDDYLRRWRLTPDGAMLRSRTSCLQPVRWRGQPAMLKLSEDPQEQQAGALMAWWAGAGAAPVFAHDAHALLMARAPHGASLARMAIEDGDHHATARLCAAAAQLHQARAAPRPALTPLAQWFAPLIQGGGAQSELLARCAHTAQNLLDNAHEPVALHGDLHHGNLLDFGAAGWLAIDPKGLYGERGFDYANLFCNPEGAPGLARHAFDARLRQVCEAAALEPQRLLSWVLAWTGLSALWHLEDGESAGHALAIAQQAAAVLDASGIRDAPP
ncbi:hypothetical protein EYB34_13730 [Bordetella trematum]|uniref:aminoglycoside phosphotransferase family protein n=1 Tax=Bordetella trematum TaxID=123899 RepID=UPI000C78E26C|nr:hypothetical protein EYB34_13730 [Bordetella trematum]